VSLLPDPLPDPLPEVLLPEVFDEPEPEAEELLLPEAADEPDDDALPLADAEPEPLPEAAVEEDALLEPEPLADTFAELPLPLPEEEPELAEAEPDPEPLALLDAEAFELLPFEPFAALPAATPAGGGGVSVAGLALGVGTSIVLAGSSFDASAPDTFAPDALTPDALAPGALAPDAFADCVAFAALDVGALPGEDTDCCCWLFIVSFPALFSLAAARRHAKVGRRPGCARRQRQPQGLGRGCMAGDVWERVGRGATSYRTNGRVDAPAASAASPASPADVFTDAFTLVFAPPPFIMDDSTSSNPRRSVAAAPVVERRARQ
jgi:hypothetical protein